jgi:uncharacterized membrane protein
MMIPSLSGVLVIVGIAIIYGLIMLIRIDQAKDERRK